MTRRQVGTEGPCEICGNESQYLGSHNISRRRCPRCGSYEYRSNIANGLMAGWLKVGTPDHMVRLSGWVREQNDAGVEFPNITMEVSRRVALMPLPQYEERANRALLVIVRRWPDLDDWYESGDMARLPELQGRSYSKDFNEAFILIHVLLDAGYLREKVGMV